MLKLSQRSSIAVVVADDELPRTGDLLPEETAKRVRLDWLDAGILVVMSAILYWGAWLRYISAGLAEPIKYRCYSLAFWEGMPSLGSLIKGDCSFLVTNAAPSLPHFTHFSVISAFLNWLAVLQPPAQAFHALPYEYPLLAIFPSSLIMFLPSFWYLFAFAVMMALVATLIYFLLKRFVSRQAAIAFALYLVLGSWATALARFDLLPAVLTLGAVILARQARWKWAFALLALAILLKFYALVLIVPLFIAQQHFYRDYKWYAWLRWQGVAICVALCAAIMGISLLLSVNGTLGSFLYFKDRPIQVETFAAALLWFGSFAGYGLHYVYSFGSGNVISTLSSPVSLLCDVCSIGGVLVVYWLQWRRQVNLVASCLAVLLVTIVFGKVFSPQYLLWLAPFVAYVGRGSWRWLLGWGIVGALTTFIYPFIYAIASHSPGVISVGQVPTFFSAVLARSLLMLGVIGVLLYQGYRSEAHQQADQAFARTESLTLEDVLPLEASVEREVVQVHMSAGAIDDDHLPVLDVLHGSLDVHDGRQRVLSRDDSPV